MINWVPYLQSVCETYTEWWDTYTLTDVVGKNIDKKVQKSLLLDLQAITLKLDREQLQEAGKQREELNVLEGLQKYALEHVLLIGRPGSGKSTALKRLLLEKAQGFQDKEGLGSEREVGKKDNKENKTNFECGSAIINNYGRNQIPVLVELRYYETSILDLITAFLHRHDPSLTIDVETIKTLLRQGRFFLLLDGVNELPFPEAQRNLQKFRQDYQQTTPMIFTMRDLGVGGNLEISKKLEMQPLTETQMKEFVWGYLPETGEQMLQQLGGRLREFGETPLLLMMLCSVFDSNGNQIPPNLGSVFRRFTEIYDSQLKQDIPVTEESRRWWKRLLQHLAWIMITSPSTSLLGREGLNKTEFLVAIPRQQAEEIFTEYLEGKVNCAADCAIKWLDDLLKHNLIQIVAENKIEFRHQLIQEYYAAERFLQEVEKLNDDEVQWDYLNYLKWTEPAALMLGLVDDEGLSLRIVRLALQVDWQLGARLAGEVKLEWLKKTVGLVESLNVPIKVLEKIKSNASILESQVSLVRVRKASVAVKIESEDSITGLTKLVKQKNLNVPFRAASPLRKIKLEAAIPDLIKLVKQKISNVRFRAASTLKEIKLEASISRLINLLIHQDSNALWRAASRLKEIKSEAAPD